MKSTIPLANPGMQFQVRSEEFLSAVANVLKSGRYILADQVSAFENAFAGYLGVKECYGVGNGTDAISVALKAIDIKPGDEVITVSQTAVASVAAIEAIGAVPVLADIDRKTRCMSPQSAEKLITPKTKALLPVHLYGHPAPMAELMAMARAHKLKVVEDCAQAHGAAISGKLTGTFGDAAAFSFYPTKNLGAFGDGGAVVTNSPAIGKNIRLLRQYGWEERYISVIPGINSRLDEIQAAILNVKLPHLEGDNERRRAIASHYDSCIDRAAIIPPSEEKGCRHAMHLYVIECDAREKFREFMESAGVQTGIHYPMAIHQQRAYAGRLRGGDSLPVTDALCKTIVSLPMFPELTDAQVEQVGKCLRSWCEE